MAPLEIEVIKAVRAKVPTEVIGQALVRAVRLPEIKARLPRTTATVAVRITSDSELRRLNREFAGDDHATDVLSFTGDGDHLGDLAISWAAVLRQAAEYGHSESAELALLCVHGLLHLLGWDHATLEQQEEVSRLTVAALKRSRIAPGMERVWSGYTRTQGLRRSPRA